jgi:hypothetical protein
MPHASEYHDDGIYFVSAKSLAETGDYSIESLPTQPSQTKYPPLWPAVLSIAWRMEPHYPENLPVAMFLCWMWMPLTLFTYRRWLQLAGLTPDVVLLLGGCWALNPYVVLFSTTMLSEMQFTFLLLLTLLCLRRASVRWAVVAGLLAALAFLTRTAGVAILPAALLAYGLRDRWRQAGVFLATMLPAVIAWGFWSAMSRGEGKDPVTLYYTNYFGDYLANFHFQEAYLYLWKNTDGILHGLGALLLPDVTQSLFDKVLAETLAIAGIIGVVRLVRENRDSVYVPYAAFAGFYSLLLVIWYFPPNERFMLPVVPLWLAGLYTELKRLALNIAVVFRKPETGQKVAGGVIAALLATVLVFCGLRQWQLLTTGLPQFYEDHAERLRKSDDAMTWVREHLPAGTRFLSANDPLLYLQTGRRGSGLFLPTIHWYREDNTARTADLAAAPAHGRAQKLEYLLLNDWDWSRDMPDGEHTKLIAALRNDPRLELVYHSGSTGIYRIR